MKFGHNLPRNQVPEWSAEYINYKGLKKLIKAAADQQKQGGAPDLAEYYYSLDRNLEDVDGFYNRKVGDASRRLKLLHERYGDNQHSKEREELEDLIGALLELRSVLRKLQWYGEVNRRGFIKITKKLDKKVPTTDSQKSYLASRVDPCPFATNIALLQAQNDINVWLSQLGEVRGTSDDASSTNSSASLTRVNSRIILSLPREMLDDIDHAIRRDDEPALSLALSEIKEYESAESEPSRRFLLNLLQRAITLHSRACILALLSRIPSLDEDDDLNKRNCIHRLVIGIGRSESNRHHEGQEDSDLKESASITPAEIPVMQATPLAGKELDEGLRKINNDDASVKLLPFLLDALSTEQRKVLSSRDGNGRLPLHYAAQYGYVQICNILIDRMKAWGQFDYSSGFDSAVWADSDGSTPLHSAVMGGHPVTTKALIDASISPSKVESWQQPQRVLIGDNKLLSMATKANFVTIVKLLVQAGADVNAQNPQGETPMHEAARFGHVECAHALIDNSHWFKVHLDVPEAIFGWTPLMVAAVDGQLEMVKFFVDVGADLTRKDTSGWTAKEHAALRGYMEVAQLLAKHTAPNHTPANGQVSIMSGAKSSSIGDRISTVKDHQAAVRTTQPVKTFGHRYLVEESMVLVSLGSMDYRKNVKPVSLDRVPFAEAHATQLDTALSVVVTAHGAHGEPTIIDLPVQDNISTEPIVFHTKDVTKVKLLFDIVPTYAGSKDQVIGRGVALLSSLRADVGNKKMNLQGDVSVPVLAAKTLDYIGSVNFNFLVVAPFKHKNMTISAEQTYWKSLSTPMVIGHRGLGKNMAARKSLQLGENTIQSFIAAANLGASYVEFDVQLTKDHVPVIYHDFLVSETGVDAPVHSLTLEQFLHVNETNSPRTSQAPSPVLLAQDNNGSSKDAKRRVQRSNSLGSAFQAGIDMQERMKHTRDFKQKGFKGNSRGHSIQAPFTTLEEMFKKLPESVGFNIEMKYPMLFETEEQEMDTYAVELNAFVDTVLKKIYDMNTKRDIIFSSFNPDICLLLSFKQPSIPILFLTDAGCSEVGDIRASSLQEAIRFASRWNLLGIVTAAEPLVLCPRLVRVVKESGLVCVSYGTLNNEPANVKLQWKEGIDAVIVDSVLAIRKGLTHPDVVPEAMLSPDALRQGLEALTVNGVPVTQTHGAVI